MDISLTWLFWFFIVALIGNRLIIRFYYKDKANHEDWKDYYLGFFHATLMALITVSIVGNYPTWLWE